MNRKKERPIERIVKGKEGIKRLHREYYFKHTQKNRINRA